MTTSSHLEALSGSRPLIYESEKWMTVPFRSLPNEICHTLHKAIATSFSSEPVECPPPSKQTSSAPRVNERTCGKCPGYAGPNIEHYKDHCRSEWHVSNLRRDLEGKQPMDFISWVASETHPIESDESESSEQDDDVIDTNGAFIMQNMPWVRVNESSAVPKVVANQVLNILSNIESSRIVVLLLRSGRFAAAAWTGSGTVLHHTTLRRYTVRRKQGGSQAAHDSSGKAARSVGANIRRQQEKKMNEELFEFVTSPQWFPLLSDPKTLILIQCSKRQRSNLLVGPLKDANTRSIPMTVVTPSFSEACRVFDTLLRFAFRV